MSINIPKIPNAVTPFVPKEISSALGQAGTLANQTKSLANQVKGIHSLKDAASAASNIGAFAKQIGLIKPNGKSDPKTAGIIKPTPYEPTEFSVDNFLANIKAQGLSRSSRFKVLFNFNTTNPNSNIKKMIGIENNQINPFLNLMCEAAEFPGRTIDTVDAVVYGPAYRMATGSTYQEVTLTLLCDQALNQKRVFDEWMDYINPRETFDLNYRDNYACSTQIIQYTDTGEQAYGAELIESYPTSVASLTSSWSDDQFHKVQVTFCYRYWKPIDIKPKTIQSKSKKTTSTDGDGLETVNVNGDPRSAFEKINDSIRNAKTNIVGGIIQSAASKIEPSVDSIRSIIRQ